MVSRAGSAYKTPLVGFQPCADDTERPVGTRMPRSCGESRLEAGTYPIRRHRGTAENYAASACSFTPSALATLSTVAKLGFPSALSAR
jgi:hypothetical protein